MIFPSFKMDSIVQVNDLFRIDLSGSSTHNMSPMDKIEVKPDAAGDFITVYEKDTEKNLTFIDWMFDTEGSKDILVKFTNGLDTKEVTKSILVKSEAQEKLFSNDEMLNGLEPNIWDLLPAGRSSFKYSHRIVQQNILRELKELEYEVTAEKIFSIDEVSWWSRYLTLAVIFESNINSGSDVHVDKRNTYLSKAETAKSKVIISLDEDEDGEKDSEIKLFPTTLVRR